MINIELIDRKIEEINADFEVIFIIDKNLNHRFVKDNDKFEMLNFKGEGMLVLPESKRVYIGIENIELDRIRIGMAKAFNALKLYNIKSFKISSYICECTTKTYMAMAEGVFLGSYEFNKYKSDKKKYDLDKIYISTDEYNKKEVDVIKAKKGLIAGKIMAEAANYTKDRVNEIPEIYTPSKMANDAEILTAAYDSVTCKIYDEDFLQQENMNAFLAVNRSSSHSPRLIHMKYKPDGECKKTIIFVGKGLTYDSGGLSLKPSDYMVTMKSDKSGALGVMGIIKGAAELKLPFEIHAIIGATENMIGGNSFKPDDVLISRSGISIEVRNTDAEGRLVLADCLSYAQDFKPDILIDMATLTGACVVGLGEYTSAILGNNNELKVKFKELIADSGELMSILEFNDHLKELIKSNIADVSNCASSRYGGALTAGLFLDKFIKDEYKDKWLHLDIAGPAYLEKAWGYNGIGATGAGVRAALYFMNALAKENRWDWL